MLLLDFTLTTKEELSTIIETVFRSVLYDQELVAPAELKPEKEIINIEEACEILNLAKPTVYTHTSKGSLRFLMGGT